MFEQKYPNHQAVFVFDNTLKHISFEEDPYLLKNSKLKMAINNDYREKPFGKVKFKNWFLKVKSKKG